MLHGLEHGAHRVAIDAIPPLTEMFGDRPVILEIGFGMGESTLAQAMAHPDFGILAMHVHTPGVGRLLAELDDHSITNVRVIEGDALHVLHDVLPDNALAGIRIFFPDPWPKTKHHKRRILVPSNLDAMARTLRSGGFLHFATDWAEYAEWALETINAHAAFTLLRPNEEPDIASGATRPRTKFESRGIAAGRGITDLVAIRV